MKLIVGLGNPDKEYENTRHNLGFVIIDQLASKLNVELNKKNLKAYIAKLVNIFCLNRKLIWIIQESAW